MSNFTPGHAGSGRNLLFGILALQMDFITKDTLVAAMNAWVLDKSKSLGQLLVDQGKLPQSLQALLDGLVNEHIARHAGDVTKSLAALPISEATRSVLNKVEDQDVHATLASLPDPEATAGFPDPTLTNGQRFRILRPHVRGGLGEVFVAHDQELHRDVALKEIQAEFASQPNSRDRFVREAEITGGLEHPGIVPVYALGQYADGRPYYAMRFIKGETLKEAIARYQQEPSGGARALALRGLLTRFVAVCNAIAYSHSRGIIHRDIKPSNIMLGKFGETLVVDWGLAKVVGRSESACLQASGSDEPTLIPHSGDSSSETQTGAALGTPPYMSPEQAAGRIDDLGPTTDIYSLGATLYTLLTGRPPFSGRDTGEILQQVQKGAWQPVRHVNRDAPAGLAAVCEKAMVLRSENRYGSALEMAAVETSLGRMADLRGQERWAQAREVLEQADRRLGANGPADLRHQVDQSRHDLELVSRLDEIHLESASLVDGHFDEKGADRAYAEEFARSGLAREEEAAATVAARIQQSSIAPQLVAALDDWANITGDDLRRAWLLETARKADPDEWRNQFRQPQVWQDRTALEQLAKKVDVVKQSPQLLSALGIGLRATNGDAIRLLTAAQHQYPGDFWLNVNLALALQKSDPREATSYYRVALAIRPETAIVYYNLGTALHGQKKLDEAVAAFRKAIDLKPDLAKSYNELGIALHNQEKLGEAVAAYKKAIDIKPDFVVVYNNLGLVLRDQKKLEEAVTAYRKAIDLKPDFAMAYDNLGLVLCDQNKLDEAVTAYGKAIDIKPDYADAYYNLGLVLQHQRKGEEAVIAYRKAIATKPDYADAYYNLGFVLQHQRKLEEVAIAYRKAIGIKPDYAEASCNLGHALRDAGKFHEALSYLKRGHQLGQKTVGWSYPSELWIKKCEQLIELDDKLVPILKGEQRPKNAEEQLALADLCMRFKNAYVSAAQFFTNAFKEAPTLAPTL